MQAGGAISASFYNSVARGLDVRIVADMGDDSPGYGFEQLLIRTDLIKNGRYKTPKDLKGMRVAVNTLGAASTVAIDRLLRKYGLTLADVTRVTLPFAQHVLAFQNGGIDASVLPEPTSTLTADTGAATRVLNADSWLSRSANRGTLLRLDLFCTRIATWPKNSCGHTCAAVRTYNDALAGGKLAGPAANDVIAILAQSSMIHDPAVLRVITPNGVGRERQARPRLDARRPEVLSSARVDRRSSYGGEHDRGRLSGRRAQNARHRPPQTLARDQRSRFFHHPGLE